MNQVASQSISSGCVGRAPILPKLLGVATSPLPKCCCQTRLTITRAVSVFWRLAIQRARASRRPAVSSAIDHESDGLDGLDGCEPINPCEPVRSVLSVFDCLCIALRIPGVT